MKALTTSFYYHRSWIGFYLFFIDLYNTKIHNQYIDYDFKVQLGQQKIKQMMINYLLKTWKSNIKKLIFQYSDIIVADFDEGTMSKARGGSKTGVYRGRKKIGREYGRVL